jgi:hypothetical protein
MTKMSALDETGLYIYLCLRDTCIRGLSGSGTLNPLVQVFADKFG